MGLTSSSDIGAGIDEAVSGVYRGAGYEIGSEVTAEPKAGSGVTADAEGKPASGNRLEASADPWDPEVHQKEHVRWRRCEAWLP